MRGKGALEKGWRNGRGTPSCKFDGEGTLLPKPLAAPPRPHGNGQTGRRRSACALGPHVDAGTSPSKGPGKPFPPSTKEPWKCPHQMPNKMLDQMPNKKCVSPKPPKTYAKRS